MRKRIAAAVLSTAFALSVTAPAWADPPPPAPGNGAGNSGQCTGPQADRPSSCVSQGGPGDQ